MVAEVGVYVAAPVGALITKSWHLKILVEHPKFVAALLDLPVVLFRVCSEYSVLNMFC
jgi:hypothetical protein